jgi:hypothetical protein
MRGPRLLWRASRSPCSRSSDQAARRTVVDFQIITKERAFWWSAPVALVGVVFAVLSFERRGCSTRDGKILTNEIPLDATKALLVCSPFETEARAMVRSERQRRRSHSAMALLRSPRGSIRLGSRQAYSTERFSTAIDELPRIRRAHFNIALQPTDTIAALGVLRPPCALRISAAERNVSNTREITEEREW